MILNRTNEIFISLLILFITLFLPATNYINGVTDPFLFRVVTYPQILYKENFIQINDQSLYDGTFFFSPATEFSIIIISKIIGIYPKDLQFIPILAIPLIFSLYASIKKLVNTRSPIIISTGVFIVLFSVSRGSTNIFVVFPHPFAYILFLIAITLLYDILVNKNNKKIIVLLIIIIGIHFYYYTVEIWILSMFLFMCFYMYLLNKKHRSVKIVKYLTLITVVMTAGFNRMIYYTYLPGIRAKIGNMETGISLFLQKYFDQNSAYNYKVPVEYTSINILFIIIVSIPIFYYFITALHKMIRKRFIYDENFLNWFCFQIALIFIGMVDIGLYLSQGVLTFRYILFIFPVVSMAFIWKYSINTIKNLWLIIIIILSILGVIMSYEYNIVAESKSRYSEFEPGCDWIIRNGMEKQSLLGDQPTIEKCFLDAVVLKKEFSRVYINSSSYNNIVENNSENINYTDFVLLNMKFKRIDTLEWEQYNSFTNYRDNITNNNKFYKIYSDNVIWILKKKD